MMKRARLFTAALGLGGAMLLGGCAVPVGGYSDYGYGPAYGGYSRPYYDAAPVVVPAPVYINGGYYDRPGYYGRPGYDGRPGYYDGRPVYGGNRPGRPDSGYRPGYGGGSQPGSARPPGRGNPTPQQLAPSIHPNTSPNDPSLPIESQRVLRERASGTAP